MRLKHLLRTALTAFTLLLWTGVGWGQYLGTGTFNGITSIGDLEAGYYVIVNSGDAFAMNNTNGGSYFGNTAVTPIAGVITDPATSIVWKLEINGGGWSIYNEASSKYVSYTGSSNAAYAVDAVDSDNQRWTITYVSDLFNVSNLAIPTRILQYNASSPRFACYTSSQQKFLFYKLNESGGDTPPQATFLPANAASDVLIGSNVTITFDEKIFKSDGTTEIVDGDLATLVAFRETNASGADVPATMTYDNTTFTITIDPTSDLDYDLDYYVAFGAVYDDAQQENSGENATFHTELGYIPIVNAYAISIDEVDVIYESSVTVVNPADYNLTGTAAITFTTATIDITDNKIVHLSGSSDDMIGDATLDNIADANTSFDFYAGVTAITYTNALNGGGTIAQDINATFHGIVSADDAFNNVWVADAEGAYNGVLIYDSGFPGQVDVGDEIIFYGILDVYNNLTQIKNPVIIEKVSTGQTPYGPSIIAGSVIEETITADTDPAEQWEGQLITVENATVTVGLNASNYYYTATDDGVTTSFRIGDAVDYRLYNISLTVGDQITVTGVCDYEDGAYRINPRSIDDIVFHYPVTFNVDMTDVAEFNPATDEIFITGSFNGWIQPGSDANYKLQDVGSNIYSIDLTIDEGTYNFKYFRVISSTPSWDNGEWAGSCDRTETINSSVTLNHVWGKNNVICSANLQWPENGSEALGADFTAYAQILIDGVTGDVASIADLNAWIGYNSVDATTVADFETGWTWVPASMSTYVAGFGDNSQFEANIGAVIADPGTYYYVSRFQYGTNDMVYGGYNSGYWDGTNNVSGVLTVDPAYNMTFSVDGANGSISAEADAVIINTGDLVVEGSEVVFTATPDPKYRVKDWIVDATSIGSTSSTYTIESLAADVDVKVQFELIPTWAVKFMVDVSDLAFIPGVDKFYISGAFGDYYGDWTVAGTEPALELTAEPTKSAVWYSITLNLPNGTYGYKFFLNDGDGAEYVGDNRSVTVVDQALTIHDLWGDKDAGAAINPTAADYDLTNPADVTTTITWYAATGIMSVDNGMSSLTEGVDYTLVGDVLTITDTYLSGLSLNVDDVVTLAIGFDVGSAILTITAIESAVINATIDPIAADFDLSNPADVSTVVTWNDATSITTINDGTDDLQLGTDYTITDIDGSTATLAILQA
ncbi:MAG TPA: X2-like carbohydrate binding domain-containing protein, partial [Tenuifilaceae bacterium]|nr:X2-like carbohydrate binding domain-containing protein [Tenuifilaceae bacterium]